MLDTNTVSYIVQGNSPAARARLARLAPHETAYISAIAIGATLVTHDAVFQQVEDLQPTVYWATDL